MNQQLRRLALAPLLICLVGSWNAAADVERPNVVLVMADDQGWGQTGYYNHPILKTPNLDAMASSGLRMDRFYAAGPVCSPTRASVLTGRTHDRTGVLSHGYALHRQERTIAQAMQKAGYATGHFGKWHLNGVRGPGVPVLKTDIHHPGHFGFDHWLTVTNFFELNPLMSRMGTFEEFDGDSSDVTVGEALRFIEHAIAEDKPFFTVIWYGSPHSPWKALPKDQVPNEAARSAHHHGELVAIDRSVGTLRAGLKQLDVSDNTLVWYCSDNGGLTGLGHDSVGGLRGRKGQIWEGGIRVPGIIEWPAVIESRVTSFPASTMDIFPTLVDIIGLPRQSMLELVDGMSIQPLLLGAVERRTKPIPFRYRNKAALIDNDLKIVTQEIGSGKFLLFNLKNDKTESTNLFSIQSNDAHRLRDELEDMIASVTRSQTGHDYADGRVTREGPHGRHWYEMAEYQPFLEAWAQRPEYRDWLKKNRRKHKQ